MCDGVVVVERFCSVVWMVVGDVVVERCLRPAAIVNLNWGKWIGFCDEVTSARDFRVPSFPARAYSSDVAVMSQPGFGLGYLRSLPLE